MLVARLRQGLLRLRTALPKIKMADSDTVPKEAAAVAMVTQSPENGQISSSTNRPLESEEQVGSLSSIATAMSAATTLADTTATATTTTVAINPNCAQSILFNPIFHTPFGEATPRTVSMDTVTSTPVATTAAVATVTQSSWDGLESNGTKRPLESDEQVSSVSSVATAMSAATTQADTTADNISVATVAATPEATTVASSEPATVVTNTAVTGSEEPVPKKLKTEDGSSDASPLRFAKRKVAMLLSYSGVGYKGMQKNPGEKTIEEDLAGALQKSEAITEEQARNFGKMSFQRCARTDKGVSAAGQVVSLKMKIFDNMVERVNAYLPPCIRVMGIKRTTGSFNSKYNCDFRTYIYMLPTFAFESVDEITTESYRVTEDKLQDVKELLTMYLGTHNFHNFTSGKAFKDPSAFRFIREFTCDEPFINEGLEFVVLRVKGQSFVLHQIRKMIGLVIAIAKGFTPKETLEKAFAEEKLDIPRAPGLGLVLEWVHYEAYNRKWGSDGMHEALTWDECKDDIEAFQREHIYPTIVDTEKKQRSMMQWLSTLPLHTYDVIETPNPYRGLAWNIERDRREKRERLNVESANSENKEERPPETASSSCLAQGDGGPEVTSTTTPDPLHPERPSVKDKQVESKTSLEANLPTEINTKS